VGGVLTDRVALVTGASQGIGRAVAERFAAAGAAVALCARPSDRLDEATAACGPLATAIPLDVTDERACGAAVEACAAALGSVDVLVHGAGVAPSAKSVATATSDWRHAFAVNVDGPFWLTRAALPGMLRRRSGAVIAVASVVGLVGRPYVSAYTASKHAVVGLLRALAAEHAASGVTFNSVCPGFVDTPMTERAVADIVERTGRTPADALAALVSPQGRLVAPSEVAELCLLLASPAGRSVNGQAITVDGGEVQR